MKKKKTIGRYVRRTLLFALLGVIVICLAVFYLGKYKASKTDYDNKYSDEFWNQLPGFIHSKDIFEEFYELDCKSSEYVKPYDENALPTPDDSEVEIIAKYKAVLDTARYKEELNDILSEIKSMLPYISKLRAEQRETIQDYYKTLSNGDLKSWDEYISPSREEVALDNGKYRLIFNRADTTFRVEDIQTGDVWYSNPKDPDTTPGIMKTQKSLMNIVFATGNKSETPIPTTYTTYENSTKESTQEKIVPDFFIKIDKEKNTLIVYYTFKVGGIDYTYFPETISSARLDELCKRSVAKLEEAMAEGKSLKDFRDSNNSLITGMYFDASKIGNYKSQAYYDDFVELFPDLAGDEDAAKEAAFGDTLIFWDLIFKQIYKEQLDTSRGYYCTNCYATYETKPSSCTHVINKVDEDGNEVTEECGCTEFAELVDYKITTYENMSEAVIKNLYRFYYEWCGYTEEDLKNDTGVEKQSSGKPEIRCAVEYQLTDNGLQVMVPGNSLKTSKYDKGNAYRIISIDVLPYFTSVKKNTDTGYIVIPDGSGAIIEFDNGKADYPVYLKRLYSTDLAFTSYTLTSKTTDVLLPMYAMVYNKSERGVIAEATKGAAQFAINAGVSGQANGNNSFNYAYYTIYIRESEQVIFGTTAYNRVSIKQYTQKGATGDYQINYSFMDKDKYSMDYSGVAKFYRDILIDRNDLDQNCKEKLSQKTDNTNNVVMNIDVIGSYDYHSNIAGIGYNAKGTLTTIDELGLIIDELNKLGPDIASMNIYYKGWRKEALSDVSFKSITVSSKIGGRKKLLNFIKENKDKNINVYPQVEFIEYNDFKESYGRSHYTSRDISGSYSEKYPYDLSSNIYNKKASKIMTLSPNYYNAFAVTLAKKYNKVLPDVGAISLTGLGSQLSGNYRRNKEIFKYTAVEEQIKAFNTLVDSGITDIALESPYAYALPYASNVYNIPVASSGQEIIDYSIPFYQLIINGLMDYSGESINEKSEKGTAQHIMKCIETGSNPAFTFTYDDSSKLLQTNYNNYYYTYYQRWLSDVKTVCDDLNGLGIYECNLVKHERVANNVYKVTYQSKFSPEKEIVIVLNYQNIAYSTSEYQVEANSYKVIKTYMTSETKKGE